MKPSIRAAVALTSTSIFVLTGCSADGPQPSPTVTVTETVTATPTAPAPSSPTATPSDDAQAASTGELSERGSLLKTVGQQAGLQSPDGQPLAEFTVNNISTQVECTGGDPSEPENGHFVELDVDFELFSGAEANYVDGALLNPGRFRFIGTDGATFSGDLSTRATFRCMPETESLNQSIGDGERSSGSVLLDVPESSGVLLLEEPMSGAKWEWEF